jgi:hypothetical protein
LLECFVEQVPIGVSPVIHICPESTISQPRLPSFSRAAHGCRIQCKRLLSVKPNTMAYNAESLSFEEPDTDMVFVEGLPDGVNEKDIAQHFGTIGTVKFDKKKDQFKVCFKLQASSI